ncbi:ArsB/NhaD family transporter [Candidatus Bipolaricaulota bacterium]|nr:ArsB/NhaD family transporter [Candidatus Bipolaricaulota bacterium]MBS3825045.1 ArsB/NhaD family transporter [Candidatus Bipolaricaulota bacterium]
MDIELILSTLIFLGTYVAILTNKVERSLAALTGAVLMVVVGLYFGFYTEKEVITQAIDWNTIGLLLGMMMVVGVLKDSGLFETLAIWAAKLARGDYFRMILLFGFLTAILSTTIDNVTTILLVAPISMSISSVLGVDPKPILLTQGLFSNIGGVATLVGDPPNIMISGAGGFHYMDYIYNLAPTVLICTLVAVIIFKIAFSGKAEEENQKINEEALKGIMERKATEEVANWPLLKKGLFGLSFIITLFVLHSLVSITPALVALTGATLILIMTRPNMDELLERVEWSTLLFFAGLFVVVHGVVETGLLTKIAQGVLHLTSGSLLFSAIAILFLTAIGSGMVDNIPFTAAMLPIVSTLSAKLTGSPNILWWALAFGAGFGGNATYIGSSANVMIVKISEDHEEPISMKYWLKYGTLTTLITTLIAGLIIAIQILTPIDLSLFPT